MKENKKCLKREIEEARWMLGANSFPTLRAIIVIGSVAHARGVGARGKKMAPMALVAAGVTEGTPNN